jgi:hypothetical protein
MGATFDGELVAFGRDGLPSFPNVCRRLLLVIRGQARAIEEALMLGIQAPRTSGTP